MKKIKNYYVFICLDGVPILELLLNQKKKAIERIEKIDWMTMKYVILDFKSFHEKNHAVIEKGKVTHQDKLLTKQFLYYRIDIFESHKMVKNQKEKNVSKKEWNIILFSEIMFHREPIEFIKYIKEHQLLRKKDILNLEKSLKILKNEQQILNSWQCQKRNEKKQHNP